MTLVVAEKLTLLDIEDLLRLSLAPHFPLGIIEALVSLEVWSLEFPHSVAQGRPASTPLLLIS